jgi:hypothetical protein
MSEPRRRLSWRLQADQLILPLAAIVVSLLVESRAAAGPMIRETRDVVVGDSHETWSLEWESPPALACHPDDDLGGWSTCSCDGFAFGERGELDLVRRRSGQLIERLPLTPFFHVQIVPWGAVAILARWPVEEDDLKRELGDDDAWVEAIKSRPSVDAMRLADYDHDGQATEFVLQLATAPCGKRLAIVVGVTRQQPKLHAFGTAEHPNVPLLLQVENWDALAQSEGATTVVEWACGDHGSDDETAISLRTDAKGMHATQLRYACTDDDSRGKLIGKERL